MNKKQYEYIVGILANPRYTFRLVNYDIFVDGVVSCWYYRNEEWHLNTSVYEGVQLRSLHPEQLEVLEKIDWEMNVTTGDEDDEYCSAKRLES